MRKLKVQLNTSLDGIVSLQELHTLWDDELREYSIQNLKDADCIILGAHTAKDLIPYWAGAAQDESNKDSELGKRITEIPKIVFSHSISESPWPNTSITKGTVAEEIKRLKDMPGKDMVVYGSASFVASLAKENLVDEYDLLVNPVAIGKGTGIFQNLQYALQLELIEARPFSCGVVLLRHGAKKK